MRVLILPTVCYVYAGLRIFHDYELINRDNDDDLLSEVVSKSCS